MRQAERVTTITWLGHSTVLIDVAGTRVLTDPVLRKRVAHMLRQVEVPALPDRLDAVLLSHLHHDHADLPTLRRLPGPFEVFGPPGTAKLVPGAHELAPGDDVAVDGVRILATEAEHDARRMPWSPADGLGFVVDGVYFAGDTDLFDGMAQIGAGGLDVALLPISGWGPRLPAGHLDPERAAEATRLLAPRTVIPIHWGTYLRAGMRRVDLQAPARAFAEAVARTAPDCEAVVLAPGESFAPNHPQGMMPR
jgi:L-ascorbate metabolism protein UlaG (beta-lactamase superfamily)